MQVHHFWSPVAARTRDGQKREVLGFTEARTTMKTARKEQIAWCYVVVTEGRLPTDLGKLLQAMREMIGEVTEDEVRASIKWALRQAPLRRTSPRQTGRRPAAMPAPSRQQLKRAGSRCDGSPVNGQWPQRDSEGLG
jgi:hypothetical protein